MGFDWQTVVAALIVVAAAYVVLRRIGLWANGTGESGCGACPNKGASQTVKTLPLVQIQPPTGHARHK
jgi:hypothetical protein